MKMLPEHLIGHISLSPKVVYTRKDILQARLFYNTIKYKITQQEFLHLLKGNFRITPNEFSFVSNYFQNIEEYKDNIISDAKSNLEEIKSCPSIYPQNPNVRFIYGTRDYNYQTVTEHLNSGSLSFINHGNHFISLFQPEITNKFIMKNLKDLCNLLNCFFEGRNKIL